MHDQILTFNKISKHVTQPSNGINHRDLPQQNHGARRKFDGEDIDEDNEIERHDDVEVPRNFDSQQLHLPATQKCLKNGVQMAKTRYFFKSLLKWVVFVVSGMPGCCPCTPR